MIDKLQPSEQLAKATDLTSTTKNDAKYDLIKFFLSLFVLAIHSALYSMALYPWLRIAVPLFFVMSSFFVFSKLREAPKEKKRAILKKFVVRNLQLYLCWFVILLPMTIYLRKGMYFSNGLLKNVLIFIRSVFFGSTFVASWFIAATIIGVLIIYFLSELLKKDVYVLLFSLFAFCIVTLKSSYTSVIADTFLLTAINKYIEIFDGLVCSFPAALFWVFIGKLFAEQKIKFKSMPLLVVLTVLSAAALFFEWKFVFSLDGSYANDSYFMLAPLCVLLFACIEKIKPYYWKNSIHFKRMSTIIYVAHASLLPVVYKLMIMASIVEMPLLTFVVTLAGCIAIYIFIEIAVKIFHTHRFKKILKMLY